MRQKAEGRRISALLSASDSFCFLSHGSPVAISFRVMTQSREDNMKRTRNLIAAAVALTTLVGTSAFAESRRQDGTSRDGSNRGSVDSDRRDDSNRSYRDNDRVTIQGRVSNFARAVSYTHLT